MSEDPNQQKPEGNTDGFRDYDKNPPATAPAAPAPAEDPNQQKPEGNTTAD
jgi:hypothetical protein